MRSIFAERRFPDQSCKNNLNVLYFLWVEGWNGDILTSSAKRTFSVFFLEVGGGEGNAVSWQRVQRERNCIVYLGNGVSWQKLNPPLLCLPFFADFLLFIYFLLPLLLLIHCHLFFPTVTFSSLLPPALKLGSVSSPLCMWKFERLCSQTRLCQLTLILLTWRIWWALNNASRWQVGFNSAFKGLKRYNL